MYDYELFLSLLHILKTKQYYGPYHCPTCGRSLSFRDFKHSNVLNLYVCPYCAKINDTIYFDKSMKIYLSNYLVVKTTNNISSYSIYDYTADHPIIHRIVIFLGGV